MENVDPTIQVYAHLTAGKKYVLYNITELAKKLGKDEYMDLLSSFTVSLDVIRYQV